MITDNTIEYLQRVLNRIVLKRVDDDSRGVVVFQLWDTETSCLLDHWVIEDHEDFEEMKRDLNRIYRGV